MKMATTVGVVMTLAAIALIIIWIVAGGYITQANVKISGNKDNDGTDYLHNAYHYSFWAAFATWTLVGLAVILIVFGILIGGLLFATGVGEVALDSAAIAKGISGVQPHVSKLGITLLVLGVVLGLITGILSAMTAVNVKKSSQYDSSEDLQKAHTDAVIASIITLTSVGLTFIAIIGYLVYVSKQKKKYKLAHEKAVEENKEYAKEILQIKYGNNNSTVNTASSANNVSGVSTASSANNVSGVNTASSVQQTPSYLPPNSQQVTPSYLPPNSQQVTYSQTR